MQNRDLSCGSDWKVPRGFRVYVALCQIGHLTMTRWVSNQAAERLPFRAQLSLSLAPPRQISKIIIFSCAAAISGKFIIYSVFASKRSSHGRQRDGAVQEQAQAERELRKKMPGGGVRVLQRVQVPGRARPLARYPPATPLSARQRRYQSTVAEIHNASPRTIPRQPGGMQTGMSPLGRREG